MIATIIILVLMILRLGYCLAKNGEPMTGTYSFWNALFGVLINIALLYLAGLFDKFFN